jgi:hypothetical protein
MLYLPSLDLAILQIPKTGCVWVKKVLTKAELWDRASRVRGPHLRARHRPTARNHALIEHGELPGKTRYAVFVRHFESWYRSWWAFHQRGRQRSAGGEQQWWERAQRGWSPTVPIYPCFVPDDFDETMRRIMATEPAYLTRLYEWYCGPRGAERVDYIGRQEHLRDDLEFVLRQCGYNGPRPPEGHANTSNSHRVQWAPDVLSAMTQLEHPLVDRFYADEQNVIDYRETGLDDGL